MRATPHLPPELKPLQDGNDVLHLVSSSAETILPELRVSQNVVYRFLTVNSELVLKTIGTDQLLYEGQSSQEVTVSGVHPILVIGVEEGFVVSADACQIGPKPAPRKKKKPKATAEEIVSTVVAPEVPIQSEGSVSSDPIMDKEPTK